MLFASRDLWVESYGDRVKIENVLTGQLAVVSPETLDKLATPGHDCGVEKVLQCSPSGQLGSQVIRAVDRFLATHPSTLPETSPERLDLCRSLCLEELELSTEARRDLKALFRNAESYLREEVNREFRYIDGLLPGVWQRPGLEYLYGQLPCMPETTQRRIALAQPIQSAESRCLILGDDDLMGLCWGLQYEQPCDIFELDLRLLDFYRSRARDGLACHQRDLRQGLPPAFHGRYDVIFTDPMYGKAGMDMFLSCCSQGLSESPRARLFLNTRPDLIEEGDHLPERLAEVNLQVVRQFPSFSRYRFPEENRQLALHSLNEVPLPRWFLRGLLNVPYYYSDLLEVARI